MFCTNLLRWLSKIVSYVSVQNRVLSFNLQNGTIYIHWKQIIFLYLIEGEKNYYANNFRLLRKYFIPFVQSVHHHVKVPATDFHPKIIRQCCDNFLDWERGGDTKNTIFFPRWSKHFVQVTVEGLFSSWSLVCFWNNYKQILHNCLYIWH